MQAGTGADNPFTPPTVRTRPALCRRGLGQTTLHSTHSEDLACPMQAGTGADNPFTPPTVRTRPALCRRGTGADNPFTPPTVRTRPYAGGDWGRQPIHSTHSEDPACPMQAGTGAVQSALRWEDCTRNTAEPSTSTCALRSPATPIPGTSRRCSMPGSPSVNWFPLAISYQASISSRQSRPCGKVPQAANGSDWPAASAAPVTDQVVCLAVKVDSSSSVHAVPFSAACAGSPPCYTGREASALTVSPPRVQG